MWEGQTETTTLTIVAESGAIADDAARDRIFEGWPETIIRAMRIFGEKEAKKAQSCLTELNFMEDDLDLQLVFAICWAVILRACSPSSAAGIAN